MEHPQATLYVLIEVDGKQVMEAGYGLDPHPGKDVHNAIANDLRRMADELDEQAHTKAGTSS